MRSRKALMALGGEKEASKLTFQSNIISVFHSGAATHGPNVHYGTVGGNVGCKQIMVFVM